MAGIKSRVGARDEALALISDGMARPKEAARFLAYGLSYVYRLMDLGKLPYVGEVKARRIPWNAIRHFAIEQLNRSGRRDNPRKAERAKAAKLEPKQDAPVATTAGGAG
jgi:hypothetical protein